MNTDNRNIIRSTAVLIALLLLTAASASAQKYDRFVKERYQTSAKPIVDIESKFGAVHVSAGSGNTVSVVVKVTAHDDSKAGAQKLAEDVRVEINHEVKGSNERVTVRVAIPGNIEGEDRGVETDVTVTLPSAALLKLRSKFGGVDITGVKGGVNIGSDFGEVIIKDCANLDLNSSFGEVSLGNITGSLSVESKMGELKAYNVPGGKISSSYGEIDITAPSGPIDITSSMGEITVKGCRGGLISSSYGEITLVMDKSFSGRIQAETSFGDIDSDFDLKSKGKKKSYGPTSEKKYGTVGSGSDKLHVRSSFGDISIEKE